MWKPVHLASTLKSAMVAIIYEIHGTFYQELQKATVQEQETKGLHFIIKVLKGKCPNFK